MGRVRRFVDSFTIALLFTVLLATVVPCRGKVAEAFEVITSAAIALLFFLHGAKLSREAIIAGAAHWRLHALVFFGTFVLFPILGLLLRPLGSLLLTPELYLGILFLCVLPSTVQSSIAFTSIAGGNVPAAVCSASASNVFSVFLTPILVGVLIAQEGAGVPMSGSFWEIVLQILVPFGLGHAVRPLIRRVGRAPASTHEPRRSRLDIAGRLRGVQRSRCRGTMEPNPLARPGGSSRDRLPALGDRYDDDVVFQRAVWFQSRGSNHHSVLRLEEELGDRSAHRQCAVCGEHCRANDSPVDALSPDPTDGLCALGTTLGGAPHFRARNSSAADLLLDGEEAAQNRLVPATGTAWLLALAVFLGRRSSSVFSSSAATRSSIISITNLGRRPEFFPSAHALADPLQSRE